MEKINNIDLIRYLKKNDLILYSKDIYLKNKYDQKIETEIKLSYTQNDNLLKLHVEYKDLFYDELEDKIDKLIYYNLGDIYLNNNIITFEKIVESDFISDDYLNINNILEHEDVLDNLKKNLRAVAVSRNRETERKFSGYIMGLRRKMIDRNIDINIIYLKDLPTVNDIKNFIDFTKIPILDKLKYQDDQYLENLLDYLKTTIDLPLSNDAKGVDLSIRSETSLSKPEKVGIFGITIPDINLYLEKNFIIGS